jgi:hypothetical protein
MWGIRIRKKKNGVTEDQVDRHVKKSSRKTMVRNSENPERVE